MNKHWTYFAYFILFISTALALISPWIDSIELGEPNSYRRYSWAPSSGALPAALIAGLTMIALAIHSLNEKSK